MSSQSLGLAAGTQGQAWIHELLRSCLKRKRGEGEEESKEGSGKERWKERKKALSLTQHITDLSRLASEQELLTMRTGTPVNGDIYVPQARLHEFSHLILTITLRNDCSYLISQITVQNRGVAYKWWMQLPLSGSILACPL